MWSVKKLREDNHKVRVLSADEEKRLFAEIERGYEVVGRDRQHKVIYPYIHLRPLIICALQTGMRRGEIFNLKWANIDFEYEFAELLETKSGKSRRVPISKKFMDVLNELSRDTEYVFVNPETQKPYNDIKNAFHTVLKKANIENLRFHDLRHTAATRMRRIWCGYKNSSRNFRTFKCYSYSKIHTYYTAIQKECYRVIK